MARKKRKATTEELNERQRVRNAAARAKAHAAKPTNADRGWATVVIEGRATQANSETIALIARFAKADRRPSLLSAARRLIELGFGIAMKGKE